MTITDIIRNEIELALDHKPSEKELTIMIEYIHDARSDLEHENKKIYLSSIEEAILLCREERFCHCEGCGEWFLPEEMNYEGYKCQNCHPDWCEDDLWEKDYE